jgi:hypothetical protein
MLSEKTLGYLDGLCHASAMVLTEGGLCYQYTAYRNTAHAHVPQEWRSAFHDRSRTEFNDANDGQLRDLARFMRGALGHINEADVVTRQIEVSRHFLRLLHADIAYDLIQVSVEDDDYGMDAKLIVASRAENDMLSIEMSWTID